MVVLFNTFKLIFLEQSIKQKDSIRTLRNYKTQNICDVFQINKFIFDCKSARIFLLFFSFSVAAYLPNLRYLESTYRIPEHLDRQFLDFRNLTTLEIPYEYHVLQILTHIGPQMKELKFKLNLGFVVENETFELLVVLALCPNLETLEFLKFRGVVNLQGPVVLVESLKLKTLCLGGSFSETEGFLPFILSAPLLEDVTLETLFIPKIDIGRVESLLSNGEILQNLTSVVFVNQMLGLLSNKGEINTLAKHFVSFCPKLQRADFGFSFGPLAAISPISLGPFQDLLTEF